MDTTADVAEQVLIFNQIKGGTYDPEPDIFYYNFLNYSGKLVFQKQSGNEVQAISLDQNNLIFSYNKNTEEWVVTDGNGWKYFLGSSGYLDKTITYSTSDIYPIDDSFDIEDYYEKIEPWNRPDLITTSWHISKILTPSGDKIEFLYQGRGQF